MVLKTPGVHHVGIPVASLERSLAFYRDLFGAEPDFRAEVVKRDVAEAVGLESVTIAVAFVTIGKTKLELLEYKQPRGRPYQLRNCDVGAIHVCFEVADVFGAFEGLRGRGIQFLTEPVELLEGPPPGGCTFVYLQDPDGIQLELFAPGRRSDG